MNVHKTITFRQLDPCLCTTKFSYASALFKRPFDIGEKPSSFSKFEKVLF